MQYLQTQQAEFHSSEDPSSNESLQNALFELSKLFASDNGASDVNFDPLLPSSSDTNNENSVLVESWFDLDGYENSKGNPGSTAPTPELSGSTNPSPESVGGASEVDHGATASNHHSDVPVSIAGAEGSSSADLDDFFNDSMFSSMKGLAGGESTYFVDPVFDFENNIVDSGDAWAISMS